MYIVAIAWGYVVLMMSITEVSIVAGVMTFVLYGILPLTIILYIMGTPQRKRNRVAREQEARLAAAQAVAAAVPEAATPAASAAADAADQPKPS